MAQKTECSLVIQCSNFILEQILHTSQARFIFAITDLKNKKCKQHSRNLLAQIGKQSIVTATAN